MLNEIYGNPDKVWRKYCGFFDLSVTEFKEIQEQLLMDQIDLVYNSPIVQKIMPMKPQSIAEFRRTVPFTTYDDYIGFLGEKNEQALPVKPLYWARTSGKGGTVKWVPITPTGMEHLLNAAMGMTILASANKKGEINIKNGMKAMMNMPPPPYLSGIIAPLMLERLGFQSVPPYDKYVNATFEERTQAGIKMAFRTGVDYVSSLTSIMIKIGERMSESSGQMKFNRQMLHPQILTRVLLALIKSKRGKRGLLPRDFFRLSGMVCYGMDTEIYKEQLINYWGKTPLEIYIATEALTIAIQAWNKKWMTCLPYCCFLEFINMADLMSNSSDKSYQPRTVLLDELKPGEQYEIVITSFHGMPFLRYRLGDIIKVVALEDKEAGIALPQIVFKSRTSDLIDIAGFPRLDERTIWKAIANTGIKYEDWCARKESANGKPVVHVYIELKQDIEQTELEKAINKGLQEINSDYRDMEAFLGINALKVSVVPAGSFKRYYEQKQKAGADLAHLKPPHMNPPDSVIRELIGN